MASLYTRPHSAFYWIKWKNRGGKIQRESTGLRLNVGTDERKARELRATKEIEELQTQRTIAEKWDWVRPYLDLRYGKSPKTLVRYRTIWRNLEKYLEEEDIEYPGALTREQCLGYVPWRLIPNIKKGKYKACHNTALMELKILGMIVQEAVERGYCPANPGLKLKIEKARPRVRPELPPNIEQWIIDQIKTEPDPVRREFLQNSFEIARYQGCRLNETWVNPLLDVQIYEENGVKKGTILFLAKGSKVFNTMLHPALIPLFESLRASKRNTTYQQPRNPPRVWHDFFKRIGLQKILPNACFHSTRVTIATRMARKNVPTSKAMKFLGHASTTVHRSYQRLRVEDVEDCLRAI